MSIDVLGFYRAALQDRSAGTALAGIAIRRGRLDDDDEPPVLLLEDAGAIRDPSLPMFAPYRILLTAFGRTDREAEQLYGAASDITHRLGPFIDNGVGLWKSYDETGPNPRDESGTHWPGRFGVMDLYVADQSISSS